MSSILFSDFTMLETYHQALSGGRFYPQEPEDLSAKQARSLREIGEFLEEKDEAVINALSSIAHSLVNMMEDVYIFSSAIRLRIAVCDVLIRCETFFLFHIFGGAVP